MSGAQQSGAVFSAVYRYLLWRAWDVALPRLLWVMLNPSTASEEKDDNTIRQLSLLPRYPMQRSHRRAMARG